MRAQIEDRIQALEFERDLNRRGPPQLPEQAADRARVATATRGGTQLQRTPKPRPASGAPFGIDERGVGIGPEQARDIARAQQGGTIGRERGVLGVITQLGTGLAEALDVPGQLVNDIAGAVRSGINTVLGALNRPAF